MPYTILTYSIENLKECFVKAAYKGSRKIILNKHHFVCFENYFNHLNVSTIVVENDYVNREYLEDYSSYYVRSFKQYDRYCTRVHFFSFPFNEEQFKDVLKNEGIGNLVNNLKNEYKGFIVLKPLPKTIIGKTCLKTYPHDGYRYFPAIRKYEVSLFGISLEVESLAYQEQDSIVAACASSAIWSTLHGTGILFQHSLPSPVDITNAAIKHFPFSNRHFPNKGLTPEQMALTIREVGLEPYLYKAETYDQLKATLYAYLMGKIPVILGFRVFDCSNSTPSKPAKQIGKHAVTISGFSLNGPLKNAFDEIDNLTLKSSRINKIYTHDDQIGPFAYMDFKDSKIYLNKCYFLGIDTTARDSNGVIGMIKALPEMLIIPLYHKIRIPFGLVLKVINSFNEVLDTINKDTSLPSFEMFEWDIYLSNIQDFKNDVFNNSLISGNSYKESILTGSFPKYIWRATGLRGGNKMIELIFDATDIEQGDYYKTLLVYDYSVLKQMKLMLDDDGVDDIDDLNLSKIITQINLHPIY